MPLSTKSLADRSGLESAQGVRFENRPNSPFSSHRILPDKLTVRSNHATEILRPGPVYRAVNHDVANLLCPKLLRNRRNDHVGIDLTLGEKSYRIGKRYA
jgi:hypothetical protein